MGPVALNETELSLAEIRARLKPLTQELLEYTAVRLLPGTQREIFLFTATFMMMNLLPRSRFSRDDWSLAPEVKLAQLCGIFRKYGRARGTGAVIYSICGVFSLCISHYFSSPPPCIPRTLRR